MGCVQSGTKRSPHRLFGETGVHVGRDGDVDLTSRSISFFGLKFVHIIESDKLHKAQRLHLSDNKLYTLGKEMLELPDIQELYIDRNMFERLPTVLGAMPNIRLLDVSKNPLSHQAQAFEVLIRMGQLTRLVLRDCSLQAVPTCVFGCGALEELDLSGNVNISFNDANFAKLAALRRLFVANCGITGVLPSSIKNAPALTTLDISANRFNFDDPDFFGKELSASVTELHLRSMNLIAVPHVIASLSKLTSLDLAQNALETVDVLAGRVVRKRLFRDLTRPSSPNNQQADVNDDATSMMSHSSSRATHNQSSRVMFIPNATRPIPLAKLSLRACDLRAMPKYFHRLTSLVELDLSDNEQLSDPNFTLISFKNLQVLNIVGCPFAVDLRTAHNEWFDVGMLSNIRSLSWELWQGTRNISPYRTRVPLEICGLKLDEINRVKLRRELFVGDTVRTTINLLMDGYYKVDIAMEDELVCSHLEAVSVLHPLRWFFFAREEATPDADGSFCGTRAAFLQGNTIQTPKLRRDVLQIALNRYIFFLTMQAANCNTVIIPPLDVMALHYAQMTQDPVGYRSDCEAICRQVLNCNYRMLFYDSHENPESVEDALTISRRVWNVMTRTVQRNLFWLQYDFWKCHGQPTQPSPAAPAEDKSISVLTREVLAILSAFGLSSSSAEGTGSSANQGASHSVPKVELTGVSSSEDLSAVLDPFITAYFHEQSLVRFEESLKKFFLINSCFIKHKEALKEQFLDWTRYVKYLALYAHVQRLKRPQDDGNNTQALTEVKNLSIISADSYLPRPQSSAVPARRAVPRREGALRYIEAGSSGLPEPRHATATTGEGSQVGKGSHPSGKAVKTKQKLELNSVAPRRQLSDILRPWDARNSRHDLPLPTTEPVPTVGIELLLHCHRTAHVKFFRVLGLLGIQDVDVRWELTDAAVNDTMRLWFALYGEKYVENAEVAFVMGNGKPSVGKNSGAAVEDDGQNTERKRSRGRRCVQNQRAVVFCCVDSQNSIY
ncbi:hypothetical protein TRVL_05522 [Trypanosoma vivax]|nr:hypothetical protein TRVL_05522 [Trypanosoma vivax]